MKLEPNDFYFENGNFVLTEHYLKKRGFCCKNGCRHCPYKLTESVLNISETKNDKPRGNQKD